MVGEPVGMLSQPRTCAAGTRRVRVARPRASSPRPCLLDRHRRLRQLDPLHRPLFAFVASEAFLSDDGRLIVASGGVGGFWRIWFPARYPWVHTSSTFRPSVRSGGAPVRSLKKLGLCEALANLGAPRVYFRETRILQGSRARLCDYAGLLRRFPVASPQPNPRRNPHK